MNEEAISMEENAKNLPDNLKQGLLRRLEPLEQAGFCQRVAQYWGDVARPLTTPINEAV